MSLFTEQFPKPPLPANEVERIQALHRLRILDTAPEQQFDDLTTLAAAVSECPIALVSLIDTNRQWFKAKCGIAGSETDRSIAFCAYAILDDDILEIPDSLNDPRFEQHPLVVGEPYIRFYAGVPLRSEKGLCYGTLCVIDTVPRRLTDVQRDLLRRLARQVLFLMESRVEQQASVRSSVSLARLLEFLPDGLITVDNVGRVQHVNSIARRWHGVDPSEVPREEWSHYFELLAANGVDKLSLAQNPLSRVLSGGKVRDEELVIRARGQDDRAVLCNGDFLLDENGNRVGAVVVMRDLSEQKRIERMKEEFVAMISHELRTPLTSISGALSLVDSGVLGEVPADMQHLLATANASSKRLIDIVNDLLDIDKLLAGKMQLRIERRALAPLLDEALASMAVYASQYEVKLERRGMVAVMVDIDALRLIQVLINLLSNACKFSPRGGLVTLEVAMQGACVEIGVRDEGPGIPPEFQAQLFQKFAQASGSGPARKASTGLGLAIAKQLVERMSGEIGVETAVGQGTRFWCRFPVAALA